MMKINKIALLTLLLFSSNVADGSEPVPPEPECLENGYEVFQTRPNKDVQLKLSASVNTKVCVYELTLSFKPDESLPFLSAPTSDDFLGMDEDTYIGICEAEGLDEQNSGEILSYDKHVGLNKHYTTYTYGMELSDKAAKSIGFKLGTLDARPCGTIFQHFPQYSFHFYTITKEEREDFKCVSDGGYFCKSYDEQCSDVERKMNMNDGFSTCPDALSGPPQFLKGAGLFWTVESSENFIGVSAAIPALGLAAFGQDPATPYILMLNDGKKVIGHHTLIWSGIANGEGPDIVPFTKETPTYNCRTGDMAFFPKTTEVTYDGKNGRTSVTVKGPLADCSGESYNEVKTSKPSKIGKTKKSAQNKA